MGLLRIAKWYEEIINMKNQTSNKMTVLITGAAGGLGKAFAVECARRGWDLFLTDLDERSLKRLADGLINTYQTKVKFFSCDLTNPKNREALLASLNDVKINLSMLIHVAGVESEGSLLNQKEDSLLKITRLNVESTVWLNRNIPGLRNEGSVFRILNVASMAAFSPMPYKATYAASKRFILDFSRAINQEMKPLNVTVTALCPAGMPTTKENISAINAQGFAGQITTMDVGRVANYSITQTLKGKEVVVPGLLNKALLILESILPKNILTRIIGQRWFAVRLKRKIDLSQI